MMKFKRLCAALLVCLLAGCGSGSKEPTKIQLLVPQGAPALATLSLYLSAYADVTSVAGSDVISAELAKSDGSYDVIIAPINLGAKMIEADSCVYRMAAIITWGNLYIVATDDYQSNDPFAAFGENAVPGKMLSRIGGNENVTYYNSVQDVQAQLLSGKVKAGLMAEPAVSATIAKAKEQGIELSIIKDLQESEDGTSKGYPQAAVFVKVGSEAKSADALAEMARFLDEGAANQEQLIAQIEKIGVDELGVPNAKLAVASWERQNLRYVRAEDAKQEISEFLRLFDIVFDEDMLSK